MPEYDIYLNDHGTPVKPKIDGRVSALENRVVDVKIFGAKGDGVTDDTAAIQAALNQGGSIFFPAGSYCVSRVTVPTSVRMINGNGATILRNMTATYCFIIDDAHDLTIKDLTVSCVDDTIHGGAFYGERLKNISLTNLRCIATAPYNNTAGDWAFMLSGSCIRMDGIYVESTQVGAWGDGVHLGWVEDFTLTNFDIHAGDDAIAFAQLPPFAGDWVDAPSKNIVVGNGLAQSSHYSCIKLGCDPRLDDPRNSYITSVSNHCVQDALFHDIIFHDSMSIVNTEDARDSTEKAPFTNITFDSCIFDDINGGRGIGTTAAGGVKIGALFFSNCKIRRYKSTNSYAFVEGAEKLVFDNCDFSDSTTNTWDFNLTDIESVHLRSCRFFQGDGGGAHVVLTRVPYICVTSCIIDAQNAYAGMTFTDVPTDAKVIFSGNVVRGAERSVVMNGTMPKQLSELLMVGNALTGRENLSAQDATVKIVS